MATLSPEPSTSSTASPAAAQTLAAPLADPVIGTPPALALAPPVQHQQASDPASTDPIPVESDSSSAAAAVLNSNNNTKPTRPPRASQRPSTASRRTSASGTDSVDAMATTAAASGLPPTEANASEKTTLVGAGAGSSGTDTATAAEKAHVDDADKGTAMTTTTTTTTKKTPENSGSRAVGTTTTASSAPLASDEKRPLTASDSTSATPPTGAASTSTAPTAGGGAASAVAAAGNSNSSAIAATSASRPRTSQPAPVPKKRKGKAGGFSLLACLPCFGSTGHDNDDEDGRRHVAAAAAPVKKPATPATGNPAEVEEEKLPHAASANEPVVPNRQDHPVNADVDEKPSVLVTEGQNNDNNHNSTTLVDAPSTEGPNAASTATGNPNPAVTVSSPTLAEGTTATPATQQRGVVLPADETEGVTSGAVVPPGQADASQVPHPPTPTPKARRRRAKQRQHAAAASARSGTEGIITSVPEPGAAVGGIVLAAPPRGGHDETTSSEVSTDEDEDDLDESEEDDEEDDEDEDEEEEEDEEQSLIARGGVGIPIGEDGLPHPLLDELAEEMHGRKCLVLDLDETLVHSSFKMVHQADFVVPVEIENQFHNVYVIKRPGVDAFLKAMGEIYEVVVFTASLSKYADPVLDHLDIHRVVKHRLFRESCYNNKGNYVKDLSQLGRPIGESIIIDNSPASYVFHPNNAVPISSWFNDPHDTELTDLIPFLADLGKVEDVRSVLDANLYPPQPPQQAVDADGITTALQQLQAE
ncbi:hypothetical protein JCM3774_003960 [Rhodotorula dairenensis]